MSNNSSPKKRYSHTSPYQRLMGHLQKQYSTTDTKNPNTTENNNDSDHTDKKKNPITMKIKSTEA